MNTGSLLDNLLAAAKTSPATKKISKQQTSSEPVEGFQTTMAQVRPKVAARASQVTHKAENQVAQPDSRPGKTEMQSRKANSTAETAHASRHSQRAAGNETPVRDSHAKSTRNLPETRDKGGLEVDKTVSEEPAESLAPEEATISTDVAFPLDQILPADNTLLPIGGSAEDDILGTMANLPLLPVTETVVLDTAPAPDLDGMSAEELAALLPNGPTEGTIISPGFANQLASSGVLQANSNLATGLNPLQGVASSQALPEMAIEGDVIPTPEATAGDELLTASDLGDNPDLLLLNAKAVMAKLAEASGSSLDKQAVELPKGLTSAAPAVETLTRLAEAQAPNARGFVVQTGVPAQVGQPQWGQGVGERVLWLAAQNVSAAEIRLDPPELGPLHVRVSVHQEQVSVSFVSPHLMVRDALDQQLQRLREMFSEQGLNLGDVDVSDKSFAQQDQERDESGRKGTANLDHEDLTPVGTQAVISTRLVDHYA